MYSAHKSTSPMHYIFFFTTPQPPSSTLFPYTTLFRSRLRGRLRRSRRNTEGLAEIHAGTLEKHHSDPGLAKPRASDRKSTRLNSSHVRISYAVFCLKKKI